eukprot:791852-Prymnesium_polylepis.1
MRGLALNTSPLDSNTWLPPPPGSSFQSSISDSVASAYVSVLYLSGNRFRKSTFPGWGATTPRAAARRACGACARLISSRAARGGGRRARRARRARQHGEVGASRNQMLVTSSSGAAAWRAAHDGRHDLLSRRRIPAPMHR